MSLHSDMNYNDIVDSVSDNSSHWSKGRYYNTKMSKIRTDYLNGTLTLSPWLHNKIYNETINLNNREITPAIEQHLMIMYLHAGGFNNNDYISLPNEYSKYTYEMITSISEDHPQNLTEANVLTNKLVDKFGLPEKYAETICWYWCGGVNCSHLHQLIIDQGNS